MVGSCFKDLDGFEVVHRNEWKDRVWNWRGIVNAAGIIGIGPCQEASYDDLIKANVTLAVDMQGYAARLGIPFLTFSTTAVYRRPPDLEERLREDAPLYPYNSYGASKMLMEASLPKDRCFIFGCLGWIRGRIRPRTLGRSCGTGRLSRRCIRASCSATRSSNRCGTRCTTRRGFMGSIYRINGCLSA